MVVVEPVVTAEKLHSLLVEGHESASLDYKSMLDIGPKGGLTTASLVELAKDVGAMQVDGGFIVVGADDQGNPTGEIALPLDTVQKCFDEARLYSQLKQWVPEPFELRTAVHDVNGNVLALIYVAARQEGLCIFRSVGNYPGGTAFRAGDVYVRHGTASEPWQQLDIQRILTRLIERRKEEWRKELSDEFRAIILASQAQTIARGPANSLTWQLDEATFVNVVLEMLRADDDIPLRVFINNAALDAGRLVTEEGKSDDLWTDLDRLTCLVALGITFNRSQWRDEGIRALALIYNLGFDQYGKARDLKGLNAPDLWLGVIGRIMALGAMCVRCRDWDGVRALVLRPRNEGDFELYASWLRHGLTMAARAGRFNHEGTSREKPSLVELGRLQMTSHTCLRPDVRPEDEAVLDSLCQFDFLSGVTAIGDSQKPDGSAFYPSFALYDARRTEPAALGLINDSQIRKTLFPFDDSKLATAFWAMIQEAGSRSISFRYGAWDGFHDERIAEFIRKHLPGQETT